MFRNQKSTRLYRFAKYLHNSEESLAKLVKDHFCGTMAQSELEGIVSPTLSDMGKQLGVFKLVKFIKQLLKWYSQECRRDAY